MKTLLIILVSLGAVFVFLQKPEPKPETFARPSFTPVIVQDERSVCDKRAELYFLDQWSKICTSYKQPIDCRLTSDTVDQLTISTGIVLDNCTMLEVYGRL